MITAAQQKKTGSDKRWLVRNEQGETFGPVDLETLKLWAKEARLAPNNSLSENNLTWTPVTHLTELEMEWVVEVSVGAFYGPIHKQALETLRKDGAIPADAIAFQRTHAASGASKTQPVSPIHPVPLPQRNREDPEAIRALERQLDLERQRTHDIMKQLQQVEVHVAASEARAEACEKAHKHYAAQTEQAQQQLVSQLEQANKQLTHIHAQLFSREQDLQRTEQRLSSTDHIEALVQECLNRMTRQQQELESFMSTAHKVGSVPVAQEQNTDRIIAQIAQVHQQVAAVAEVTQAHVTATVNQTLMAELEKVRQHLADRQSVLQREAVTHVVQALTQNTKGLSDQLAQHGQELHRLNEALHAVRGQVAESVVKAVDPILEKGREAVLKALCAELVAGRDELFERTQAAMIQGREQMMRATGESQRMAIEYIVRELTTTLNQALQAGRETLLQAMRGGWSEVKQQTVALDVRVSELHATQTRLEKEVKAALEKQPQAAAKPTVERTYVEAEAVEVIPPERPQKKRKPEPEVAEPPPPPAAKSNGGNGTAGLSMADIEQQARRELERLGAQGMNIFKRKS